MGFEGAERNGPSASFKDSQRSVETIHALCVGRHTVHTVLGKGKMKGMCLSEATSETQ